MFAEWRNNAFKTLLRLVETEGDLVDNDTVCAGEKMMILIDAHVGGPIELFREMATLWFNHQHLYSNCDPSLTEMQTVLFCRASTFA
jgi:hypothetical protein